ncbi:UNVERIFIED_CONTAM: hypothetical protein H355_004012 [Colinus virginianus]|nr:hypothetical protein H355_004012 [Colinus virginianus]
MDTGKGRPGNAHRTFNSELFGARYSRVMEHLEMEGNQITLDSLEKGTDNPAFSSLGEVELYEERDGPCGGNEKRGERNGRIASYCRWGSTCTSHVFSPQEGPAASLQGKELLQGSQQGIVEGLMGAPWSG